MKDFYDFASDSPFLAFFIVLLVCCAVEGSIKAVAKIWWH